MAGKVFGRLTAIKPVKKSKDRLHWECRCLCGNTVIASGPNIRNGTTKSCGCLSKSIDRSSYRKTHGYSYSPTYKTWNSMKNRCGNPLTSEFRNYGGRGIKVCDRWQVFENFLEDMGERPDGMTLDRIDADKGYEKSNCRWATKKEQALNRRSTVFIELNGRRQTITAWATETGIDYGTIRNRLDNGHPPEEVLKKNWKSPLARKRYRHK